MKRAVAVFVSAVSVVGLWGGVADAASKPRPFGASSGEVKTVEVPRPFGASSKPRPGFAHSKIVNADFLTLRGYR